jgi:hypothetical protein
MYYRKFCCLCSHELIECHKIEDFVLSISSYESKEGARGDLSFGYCVECGSIQLMTLIDTNIVYNSAHNTTFFSELWQLHHRNFSQFILNENSKNPFIEIGGASLEIYKYFKDTDYSIFDFSKPDDKTVKFQIGNCEDFIFDPKCDLIMSHTLEHLYNPINFAKNCKCENIFLSMPCMDSSIEVWLEHTYYAEPNDIINLFGMYGYKCEKIEYFKNHSYFMHLKRTDDVFDKKYIDKNRHIRVLESMKKKEELYSNYVINENDYISPAGINGYYVYHFAGKPKIKGFLDNDSKKHYKYMYGTDVLIFPFTEYKTGKVHKPINFLYNKEIDYNIDNI